MDDVEKEKGNGGAHDVDAMRQAKRVVVKTSMLCCPHIMTARAYFVFQDLRI